MSLTLTESPKVTSPPMQTGEPVWELAREFPVQGEWTEADYLALQIERPVELSDGQLEFPPMPTLFHQGIAQLLHQLLRDFVFSKRIGEAFLAPSPIRLWAGKMREPDIFFLKSENIKDRHRPPETADLVMEVLSEGKENRQRDVETKLAEYAQAGIPEYWIIDPELSKITVYSLVDTEYAVHGEFEPGSTANSATLSGFKVDVATVFAAGDGPDFSNTTS